MASGTLGALLGLGGGVFLVPFLNLVLGFSFGAAAAISLTTVIATSSTVSAGRAGKHLINMKLGMLLEVATAAGSFLGGLTAQFISQSTLQKMFGIVAIGVALIMLTRLKRRNVILDPTVDPGTLGGRYFEQESGGEVMVVAISSMICNGTYRNRTLTLIARNPARIFSTPRQ